MGGVFGNAICALILHSGPAITNTDSFANHIVPSLLRGAGVVALALIAVLVFIRKPAVQVSSELITEEV